jgi:hypothetical protein
LSPSLAARRRDPGAFGRVQALVRDRPDFNGEIPLAFNGGPERRYGVRPGA